MKIPFRDLDNHQIQEKEIIAPNQFGGADILNQQVLKSAAGYYIGTLYQDGATGFFFPNSRDSEGYFPTRATAEAAFKNCKF
jgi:hypothetical protein